MIFNELDHYDNKEYFRLTKGMEYQFLYMPTSFMVHCEQIIFGNEYKDLSYFCFHLFTDEFHREKYEQFTQAMEMVYLEVDRSKFKNLANNISNLLIFLREPKARVNDSGYIADNLEYWQSMVSDDEILKNNCSFTKYLT